MKPIIMSTEDVRALLDGRKTMFRLVAKELDGVDILNCRHVNGDIQEPKGYPIGHVSLTERCKFKPGDVLYVRETWTMLIDSKGDLECFYRADMENPTGHYKTTWRSPITMPREAARLFLRVKDVRVERIHSITAEDAVKEGVYTDTPGYWDNGWSPTFNDPDSGGEPNYINGFKMEWDARNAKRGYGWDSNPWVWVIEFGRIEKGEES